MKSKVANLKLPIPDDWLAGVEEVEIHREQNAIVIVPLCKEDPIHSLGSQPVSLGLPDASTNHDAYL
jgi:virulence-associated protein VagC